ncbi:DegV family EDD domain-containing protein [Firmicutes bacterium M10-2]|nr:DegV family EDD domain-containing protein [Firmicutes bacterium M10-2]
MVKIISDTSTLYSTQEALEKGISIVPLNIIVEQHSYKDLDELSSSALLAMIKNKKIPTSSQPSLGEKQRLYAQESKKGEILDITMAQGLSGTYDSACLAKNLIDSNENIFVFNSKTLCGPHRALVDRANQLNQKGYTAAQIIEKLTPCVDSECSFLIPRDFSYLNRGGRVSNFEAHIGGFLKLVPTMKKSKDGSHLEMFGITKTFKKAIKNIIDEMRKQGVDASYTFYISHAFNEEEALKAQGWIEESFLGAKVIVFPLSPAFIVQGGPGCIAIQTIKM